MKRLINTVELEMFQDDATGAYGLAHKDCIDYGDGNDFNAFFDGIGIFHDVFEHWFEGRHKYFKGFFARNVGGEIAAMGACAYLYYNLGVHNRPISNRFFQRPFFEDIVGSIEALLIDGIHSGYTRFGQELLCNVPYQRPCEGYIEDIIDETWLKIAAMTVDTEEEQEREDALLLQQSCKKWKVRDLYRYGFRMAERMIPDTWDNRDTLVEFIDFWNNVTKHTNAEELYNLCKGITFKIYRDGDEISWKAVAVSRDYMVPDVKIDPKRFRGDLYEAFLMGYEE